MSSRISNDTSRLRKKNEISTFGGRYQLNAPGPGIEVKYNADPQLRLQKFGANLMTNMIGIEDDLMCRTKIISRDYLEIDNYKKTNIISKKIEYGEDTTHVLESRTDLPAWTFRENDQYFDRFEHLWINPQNSVEKSFNHNIQTRLMEKRPVTDKSSDLLSYW